MPYTVDFEQALVPLSILARSFMVFFLGHRTLHKEESLRKMKAHTVHLSPHQASPALKCFVGTPTLALKS